MTNNEMLTAEYWRGRQPRTPDEMAALAELVALALGWKQVEAGFIFMWQWGSIIQRHCPDYPRDLAACRDALYETFKFKEVFWTITARCCTIRTRHGEVEVTAYADTEEVACCLALVLWFAEVSKS